MKILSIDYEKCTDCNTCRVLLPEFTGEAEIQEWAFKENHDKILFVVRSCDNKALCLKDK